MLKETKPHRHLISEEWIQPLVMICTVAGLFLWNHHEMHLNQKETRACIYAIHEEMKDFHSKLCVLEQRTRASNNVIRMEKN